MPEGCENLALAATAIYFNICHLPFASLLALLKSRYRETLRNKGRNKLELFLFRQAFAHYTL
jgi:hypothetical protein